MRSAVFVVLVALWQPGAVASELPTLEPPRYEEEPTGFELDGRLDDPVWGESVVTDRFVRLSPVPEGYPTYDTTARLFYTREALYFGFECEVPRDELHVALTPRDSISGDLVEAMIDTFGDSQRSYTFTVSAAGSQHDRRDVEGQGSDRAWDTTFQSEVHISEGGYSVEMRIPFRDLRFSEEPVQHWRLQMSRWMWGEEERGSWVIEDPDVPNELIQYGHLTLRDIEQGSDWRHDVVGRRG